MTSVGMRCVIMHANPNVAMAAPSVVSGEGFDTVVKAAIASEYTSGEDEGEAKDS